MITRGINFVFERRKKLTKSQENDRVYFRWSLIALGVVMGIFLITLGLRLFFVFRVKGVKDQQEVARRSILTQQQVEKDYNIFAHKLKQLSQLFGRRKNKQDALVFFSELFGDAATVSGIDYSSSDTDIVTFTLHMKNIFMLDQVFSILKDPVVTDEYPSIQKSSLRRGSDGAYRLRLTINLVGGTLPSTSPAPSQPPASTTDEGA